MSSEGLRFIIFRLGGERYALSLADVAEVMEPCPAYPIPRTPGCLTGMMSFHGSLVAVMDLTEFLGLKPTIPAEKMLVLDRRFASLALLVERVERIVPAELVLNETDSDNPLVERVICLSDGDARLLAVDLVVARVEEQIEALSHDR